MTETSRLALSALAFAVLWTAGMLWWTWPHDAASAVTLVIAGAIAGLLWYWIFGWWNRRYLSPKR